jgi:hypothetical protein
MEEKIGEKEDKFSPKMPNLMPIVIQSDIYKTSKRDNIAYNSTGNSGSNVYKMKKSANIIVIPI